jgi:biopolymer transport protein ExbD
MRVDKEARYGKVGDMIESLREVKALKVSFATRPEGEGEE